MKLHKINRVITSTAIPIVAILLLLFVSGQAARANPTTTFTVNTVLDQIDDNAGDGNCHTAAGHCSLRAAVMEANAGSSATIVVPAGTYTLTLTGNGDLELRQDITLNGAGSNLTIIQGNPAGWTDRILRIRNNANATINGVTIRYGHAADFGGGIYVVTGTLTLKNSTVVSNTAGQGGGGGIYNGDHLTITLSTIMSNSVVGPFGYFGGGVYNAAGSYAYLTRTLIQGNVSWGGTGFYNDSGAQAHVNFSTISSNHAITGGGAGLWNNGIADLTYVTVTNNLAAEDAGGIYNGMGANAIIIDPFIAHNTAPAGGGAYNDMTGSMIIGGGSVSSNTASAGPGGGVYNNSNAKLTILLTDISHNQAQGLSGDGGGVFGYGPLVIEDSNFSSNSGHYGGGVYSTAGITLTLSTLANNSAIQGGGLDIESGGGSIDQSTFSGNTAMSGGGISVGGVFTDQITIDNSTLSGNIANNGDGGGLIDFGLHLYLTNDTLSHNQAIRHGGGMANTAGFPRLNNVTIAGNTADSDHNDNGDGGGFYNDPSGRTVVFYNTLIAGNVDTSGQSPDCAGQLTSEDHNLIQSTLGCTITGTTTHNITGKNPLLGSLQDNGGPTWTRALWPDSPAIDAGSPEPPNGSFPCATKDQRGVARPIGPYCDIGAYEAPIYQYVYVPLVRR
jgi:CSLREA domain-containing protein